MRRKHSQSNRVHLKPAITLILYLSEIPNNSFVTADSLNSRRSRTPFPKLLSAGSRKDSPGRRDFEIVPSLRALPLHRMRRAAIIPSFYIQ